MKKNKIEMTAKSIFDEHKNSNEYKASLGEKGLFEQTERNERFYVGDQWLKNSTKSNLPLIVINFIKRIGEYKLSQLLSNPLTACFSAEGIPSYNTDKQQDNADYIISSLQQGDLEEYEQLSPEDKINITMQALTDYFGSTCERLKFDNLCNNAIKNAYVSGTGCIYTYWDENIQTGLFADSEKKVPIKGDIVSEVLNAEEQLDFENPAQKDINRQDYIIISKKITVAEAKRIAKINGIADTDIEKIKEDGENAQYSYERDKDLDDTVKRVTVLTKIFKQYNDDFSDYSLWAVMCTSEVIIKEAWELGLKRYPIALFSWIDREKSIFGDSEVTYLIPNQIAVNRMTTAATWSAMLTGMPIMLVNENVVKGNITNQPGAIWKFNGAEDMRYAAHYIQPPQTSTALTTNTNEIINSTLQQSGANDAALGNLRSDNASAIVTLQEAANAPMQPLKNRYYQFVEDVVRIWAEFWFKNYGERKLKIEDENGNWFLPFNSENYKDIVLSVRIDVGANTIYSVAKTQEILTNWLMNNFIDFPMLLKHFPKGVINDLSGLYKEVKKKQLEQQKAQEAALAQQQSVENFGADDFYNQLTPEEKEKYDNMSYEQQQEMINSAKQAVLQEGETQL